jgi:hypothetical protein
MGEDAPRARLAIEERPLRPCHRARPRARARSILRAGTNTATSESSRPAS